MKEDLPDIDMEFYLEIVEARLIYSQVPQLTFFSKRIRKLFVLKKLIPRNESIP